MSRIPLPSRRDLSTLQGLVRAIVGGINAQGHTQINESTVMGFINAFEDDDLLPLKLIWMQKGPEAITPDSDGTYDLRKLSGILTEIISVFDGPTGSGTGSGEFATAIEYHKVTPSHFRSYQLQVLSEPIYTVEGHILRLYPPFGWNQMYLNYYADFAKLNDVSSLSSIEQRSITITGTTTADTSITFTTLSPDSDQGHVATQQTFTLPIASGQTAAEIQQAILNSQIPFDKVYGNNTTLWSSRRNTLPNTLTLVAPNYFEKNSTFSVSTPAGNGLTLINGIVSNADLRLINSNWYTQNFPYLYYYGALKHAFLWLRDKNGFDASSQQMHKHLEEVQRFNDRAEVAGAVDEYNYGQNVQW